MLLWSPGSMDGSRQRDVHQDHSGWNFLQWRDHIDGQKDYGMCFEERCQSRGAIHVSWPHHYNHHGLSLTMLNSKVFKKRGMPIRAYQLCLDKVLEKLKSNGAEQCQKAAVKTPARRASVSSISSLSDLGTTPELTDDELTIAPPQSLQAGRASNSHILKNDPQEKFSDDILVEPPVDHRVESSRWHQSSPHSTRDHQNDRQSAASKKDPKCSIELPSMCLDDWRALEQWKQSQPSPSKRKRDNSRRSRAPAPSPEARPALGSSSTSSVKN